jgi:anti-sigma regulatory factor (Ser/Thr protein kinase)
MRTREVQAEEATVNVKFCLMFPREALSVPVMRHVLGDTLRKIGVDDDAVGDLLLAVTEACTNVLQHSGEGHQYRYEVLASVGPDNCLLEVVDSGSGFRAGRLARHRMASHFPALPPRNHRLRRRPLAPPVAGQELDQAMLATADPRGRFARARRFAADRSITDLAESGRGLAIMRACVDNVSLRSGPGRGTVVSLQKHISRRRQAPPAAAPPARLRDVG